MASWRGIAAVVACVVWFCFGGLAWAQSGDDVVATIGERKVTRAELQQKEGDKLLQARYQYYLAERKALDQVIDQQLLETEAGREHVSVKELLERHVNSQVQDPTEAEMKVYYEGLDTEEPFAALRPKILQRVRERRLARARSDYLESLRKDNSVMIALAPPSADVPLGNAPLRGRADAPVLMIEFADYQCPYCQKIHPQIKKLQDEFGGKVAVAFKDFPLPMHEHAEKAAEAARCAGEQGKFWEFHDMLFEDGQKLETTQLKEHARSLKLDTTRFDTCLDSGAQAAAVQKDATEGKGLGLTGTPSFFLNGHFFSGAVDYSTLHGMIEQELARSPTRESAQNRGQP